MTQAEPVSEVLLDYRYAFGGHYTPEVHEVGNDTLDVASRTLYYPDNSVGRGWLPKRADYKQVPGEVAKYLKILTPSRGYPRLNWKTPTGPSIRPLTAFPQQALAPSPPGGSPGSVIKALLMNTGETSGCPTGRKTSTTAFTTAPRRIWSRLTTCAATN